MHDFTMLRFLIRHLLYGIAGGLVFGGGLLLLDFADLYSLISGSQEPLLWLLLLFFGLFATFGSVAMGVGVMSLGDHRDYPRR